MVCEGRNSVLRRQLDLPSTELPVPFDVWWFQLPKRPGDEQEAPRIAPRLGEAEGLLRLARPEHDQLAYLAPKGSDQQLRAEGVAALRQRIASLAPELTDRLEALTSMDDVHRLDVRLDRLRRWYAEGVLCIGDAAHAMTPVGGVGINLAIQDAVAAARILGPVLQRGRVAPSDLARVQRRRMPPTRVVQWMQRAVNARVLRPVFERRRSGPPPALPALMKALPVLSALPARLISYGPGPSRPLSSRAGHRRHTRTRPKASADPRYRRARGARIQDRDIWCSRSASRCEAPRSAAGSRISAGTSSSAMWTASQFRSSAPVWSTHQPSTSSSSIRAT